MSALTKIFIVLMLVVSLVSSVVLMVGVSRQKVRQDDLERLHASLTAAQAAAQQKSNAYEAERANNARVMKDETDEVNKRQVLLETEKQNRQNVEIQLLDAKQKIEQANNQVGQLTAANESMSKQLQTMGDEIRQISPENVKLTSQNADLARANNELLTQNRYAEQAIRKLQEENARPSTTQGGKNGAAAPAESGAVASLSVQTPVQINGTVNAVTQSAGRSLVEIKLGARDGVRQGTTFVVLRGSKYIGDAKVETVTPDACVAVTTLKPGEAVKAGDIVTSGSAQ